MSEQAQESERPKLDSDACRYALEVTDHRDLIDAGRLSQALGELEQAVDTCIQRGISLPIGVNKPAIQEAKRYLSGDLTVAADVISTLILNYISRENAGFRTTGELRYRPKIGQYYRD